jgi:hypothetical protein
MTELQGDDAFIKRINEANIEQKCQKYLKPLARTKRTIDFKAIGSKSNNDLIDLLRCQGKTKGMPCIDVEKAYAKCHTSVMGTGIYQGKKNCAEELEKLFSCALSE